MDPTRFDRFTRKLGARLPRRRALAAGAAGLAAVGLARRSDAPAAQEATPAASPGAEATGPAFLFVQLAEGGTWAPKPDEDGVYLLTLAGPSAQTVYFSDRPARVVGTVPTDDFLEALGFTAAEPPNAAVVVRTPDGEEDVLVVELFDPVYTRDFGAGGAGALTYEARVLTEYQGEGLAGWAPQAADNRLPAAFSQASLFIDDCANGRVCCKDPMNASFVIPTTIGCCWSWSSVSCKPCGSNYDAFCNEHYPSQCHGQCYATFDPYRCNGYQLGC
jgi:hypothetical protein